jgi:hypothetical protein
VTTISATFAAGHGIARRDRLDREAAEDLAGLGHVVDRQDEPACDPPQPRGQADELGAGEDTGAVVVLRAPIKGSA